MDKYLILLLIACCTYTSIDGARILAFTPFPAKGHQRAIQPLLKELAVKGHQVVCYTPFPIDNPPKNYQTVKVTSYLPEIKKHMLNDNQGKESYTKWKSTWAKLNMVMFKGLGLAFSDWAFQLKEVQDLIHSNEKFDAVILETTFFQETFIALGHKFQAPVIEILPAGNVLWSYWLHGNPSDTSYIADIILPYTDKMTFPERFFNTFFTLLNRAVWYNFFMPKYQSVMDKYMRYEGWESRPSMMDMISNTSMVLVNSHFSLGFPFPQAAHFKEIGGMNVETPKQLPKDFEDFMNTAKDGVIYFTLGSSVDVSGALGNDLRVVFSKVFGELKQKVLWKWETEFPDPPANVKIGKWFPQQDILAHKNIKLFITHGGLMSMTEAIYQGVPTIGIPILADQFRNVAHMELNKYGLKLDLENITYTSLKWAIKEILDNPEYTKNAKKQSELFRDKPETALETAVYWTEYVIRHKGAHHLKPAIATMPWYQQALIDVYLAIALIILIPLYITYKVFSFISKMICGSRKERIVKKQKTN